MPRTMMSEPSYESPDAVVQASVAETAQKLADVRAGLIVRSLPDFLSRAHLPSDPDQRCAAITAYAEALLPGTEVDHTLARNLLAGAILATVSQINDLKAHDDYPRDAAPDFVLEFLSPLLTLIRPAAGTDPLWGHLRDVILNLPRDDHGIVLSELFEPLCQARAPERRRAISRAIEAMNSVVPPEYNRIPFGGPPLNPLCTLERKFFEEPYRLDDGEYLTRDFFRQFCLEQSTVNACLRLMRTSSRRSDDPVFH